MSPHKGESQNDFMSRCVPEMMGDGKRDNDQAVAACISIWNDSDKQFADPGYLGDRKKRFPINTPDELRVAWYTAHKQAKNYTPAQHQRVITRIAGAWKVQLKAEPPAPDDETLRAEVLEIIRKDVPEPDDDENHDDFMDRCMDEMSDMDDDDAEDACQTSWDECVDDNGDRAGPVFHKTHADAADGMEFVLSDATPDRFGDIVEADGWVTDNFSKNPIALFGHQKDFPIGKWKNVRVHEGKALRGELQLAPKGTSDRIDEIRKLIEADILRAVSVGFVPLESEEIKGTWGTRFKKHELVECSLVSVPANPNALAVAKSLNISPATVRMVFGEHAGNDIMTRDIDANRGKHASKQRSAKTAEQTGEHADPVLEQPKGKPMLLSQRIQEAEKNVLALQDNLDTHLASIDDNAPTDEQMTITEDLSTKIEAATRHVKSLKAIEARNGNGATDAGELAKKGNGQIRVPAELIAPAKKKLDPIDFVVRAAIIRAKAKIDNVDIDTMRRKIYGDHEATRMMADLMLKAASAPAETTVTGWAAELVRTIWAAWMDVLLPHSVYPKLAARGIGLTFGANGKIIIPTRNLTPAVSGSFVGEGAPIPVRQGAFSSQTLVPKKMAVITSWTREMDEHSIPAIEGLLRQAIIEDTAIALDAVLLDSTAATAIRPNGLRAYQAGTTASAVAGQPFQNFVADYKALFNALLTLTNGNVRDPVMIINPAQALAVELLQPPAAAAPLFPFMEMVDGDRILRAGLIESSNQPAGQVTLVDAADFVSAGAEGPRMEISDQATLHMEDTSPADIVSGPSGTPVPATPVKSMWQTDSLALRMIMFMNWIMRRPVVAWTTGVQWG
jgi:HK97 family phage prohead protease